MSKNKSIVKRMSEIRDGTIRRELRHKLILSSVLNESSFFGNMVSTHNFQHLVNKMLSSLEWHPNKNLVLIGSRGGDVSAVDLSSDSVTVCGRGEGRGAQITDIKFDRFDNNWFYTSSTSGKLLKRRIDAKEEIILKSSLDFNDFYSRSRFSCLDVCWDHRLVIAGDSNGLIHLTPSCESNNNTNSNKNGLSVSIHDSNVIHCEFNRFNTNSFITASIDCSAKLWDIRMISNNHSKPILTIKHSYPLNCATFSLTNGSTLLTINNFDEICVYCGPDWQLEKCIKHSHEQTQRFCLLKAKWHPLCDMFIIGSFSSNPLVSGQYYEIPQTIDIIDVKSGRIIASLSDGSPGVLSISSFNCMTDTIAAIKGQNLIIFESKAKD